MQLATRLIFWGEIGLSNCPICDKDKTTEDALLVYQYGYDVEKDELEAWLCEDHWDELMLELSKIEDPYADLEEDPGYDGENWNDEEEEGAQ
jgi:hypothetical protein